MNLARPLLPPIAPPLRPGLVLRSVLAAPAAPGAFEQALARATDVSSAALFDSGRGALAAVLSHWSCAGRDEVVLPAYTCWSVPAAAVRAGLRVRLVDVDPGTLDFADDALERVALERAVAVVPTHLFGRSCAAARHLATVRRRDPEVRVVEDAAQWWPGAARSAADAVLLSFGRGKPVSIGGGGALLFPGRDDLPRAHSRPGGASGAIRLLGQLALARPALFRWAAELPFLGVGRTVYDPSSVDPEAGPRLWQERLGLRVLARAPLLAQRRSENAATLLGRIGPPKGWSAPAQDRLVAPLRLPLLAPSAAVRDATLRRMRALGVAASGMYPGALDEIPRLAARLAAAPGPLPGAHDVRARLLTLPCFPTLAPADVTRVADVFLRAVADALR